MSDSQKHLLAYLLIALVLLAVLISPTIYMRLKSKRTGKVYTPMQRVKGHLLYLVALVPGLIVFGLHSMWDALDNKFNS